MKKILLEVTVEEAHRIIHALKKERGDSNDTLAQKVGDALGGIETDKVYQSRQ